jgi:hypothetical protein
MKPDWWALVCYVSGFLHGVVGTLWWMAIRNVKTR